MMHKRRASLGWRVARWGLGLVGLYFVVAFLVLPLVWKVYEGRHPAIGVGETITRTASGIPGDPIDVGLVGSEEELHRGMLAAGWYPADPITVESSLRIAVGVVFKRPFDEAPVSPLYLFGRKQDLAFEKPVGNDPRQRHHVRFWKAKELDDQGRPLWLGSATFDERVGFSRDTGQFTHVIAPRVDADRDLLLGDLKRAGALEGEYWVEGYQKVLEGKNGEGDPWRTDGRLGVGVLRGVGGERGESATRPGG